MKMTNSVDCQTQCDIWNEKQQHEQIALLDKVRKVNPESKFQNRFRFSDSKYLTKSLPNYFLTLKKKCSFYLQFAKKYFGKSLKQLM